MRLSVGLALLIIFGILGSVVPAHACSCMSFGPPCQAYWKTQAVFDATVVDVGPMITPERVPGGPFLMAHRNVTLDVHQSWKGVATGRLEITTGPTDGGCGYPFKKGERYLVFAVYGYSGRLGASICSLTQPYSSAAPALEFLASLAAPARGGRVFGTVNSLPSRLGDRAETPTETVVRLLGGTSELSITSAAGRYEFTGLSAGSYRVEVASPKGYATEAGRDLEIVNQRACAEANYTFAPAGRITGRLVDTRGDALPRVRVEVIDPETKPDPSYGFAPKNATTDDQGYFDLPYLPAGRYIAGVNLNDLPNQYNPYARTVYPSSDSEPHVIELALGQVVDLGTWYMPPPLTVVRVAGIITRLDGTPAAGVYVGSWDRTGNPINRARGAGGATSGPDGGFVLELRAGRIYTFTVRDTQSRFLKISAPRIDTGERLPELIRIVLLNATPGS